MVLFSVVILLFRNYLILYVDLFVLNIPPSFNHCILHSIPDLLVEAIDLFKKVDVKLGILLLLYFGFAPYLHIVSLYDLLLIRLLDNC